MKTYNDEALNSLFSEITPEEQARTDAKMLLAVKIADAMQSKGWNKTRLMKEMGKTNPSEITRWLSGTQNFTVDTLVDLERVLDIKLLNPGETRSSENMSASNISFKFRNIDIVEFSFVHPKQLIPENATFRFETQIEHKVNLDEKIIIVASSFSISCDDLHEKVGNAVISCVYNIENIEDFVNENNKFTLPEQLLTLFNSISISTCRGVLFTLFRGTPLHTVILPIINPADLNKQQY